RRTDECAKEHIAESSRRAIIASMSTPRTYRAGQSIEDFCRACNTDRMHTVIVVDREGRPLRVDCGFCHSEHNYRGGPRVSTISAGRAFSTPESSTRSRRSSSGEPFPLVSTRERAAPPMSVSESDDLELLLRRIIREETGVTPVVPSEKWRGGTLVLRPA